MRRLRQAEARATRRRGDPTCGRAARRAPDAAAPARPSRPCPTIREPARPSPTPAPASSRTARRWPCLRARSRSRARGRGCSGCAGTASPSAAGWPRRRRCRRRAGTARRPRACRPDDTSNLRHDLGSVAVRLRSVTSARASTYSMLLISASCVSGLSRSQRAERRRHAGARLPSRAAPRARCADRRRQSGGAAG